MSVKDIKSQLQSNLVLNNTVTANKVTNGDIVDNANYDLGVMFVVQCTDYTDGTYKFSVQEGSNSDLSDATLVPDTKIIGDLDNLNLTSVSADNSVLGSVGVFSNKRYLRLRVTSTAVTTGAHINAIVVQSGEIVPV